MKKVISTMLCVICLCVYAKSQFHIFSTNYGRTNPSAGASTIRAVSIGRLPGTADYGARLHVSNHFCNDPSGTFNGKLFRTDGYETVENYWQMFTNNSTGGAITERLRISVLPTTFNIRYKSLGTASQIWETNAGSVKTMTYDSNGDLNLGTSTQLGHFNAVNSSGTYRIAGNRILGSTATNTYCGFFTGTPTGWSNTIMGYRTASSISSGFQNTCIGTEAAFSTTTGVDNTTIGNRAGFSQVSTFNTTMIGSFAGEANQADESTFVGFSAGRNNVQGTKCTFVGFQAGLNSNAEGNTFMGWAAGWDNLNGSDNTAVGAAAGQNLQNGTQNVFVGARANGSGIPGGLNTMVGFGAGSENLANGNTFLGGAAGVLHQTGDYNTFIGERTAVNNISGTENTFVGGESGQFHNGGNKNTFVGNLSGINIMTRDCNTHVGYASGASGDFENTIALGCGAIAPAPNEGMIGDAAFTALWMSTGLFLTSDERTKTDIKENVPGLEFITQLEPVTYHYDIESMEQLMHAPGSLTESDIHQSAVSQKENLLYSGFIAQDVEKIANSLGYEFSGIRTPNGSREFYGLDYSNFVVPIVQSIKEQQIIIENQAAEITALKQEIAYLRDHDSPVSSLSEPGAYLLQNNPNPFSEKTTIRYSLPAQAVKAEIRLYSLNGEWIKTFTIDGSGKGTVEVDGNQLQSGTYVYSLYVSGQQIESKWMTLTE
ncbi:MAG: tail fiber domain-containing protein [Flavobacteriales bacterium]|nr:tail fiber domain-containing protein [Flavobacteriales bacterium]